MLVQRTFAIETADGALDALRVAGVDPSGSSSGKSLALAVQLARARGAADRLAVVLYGRPVRLGGAVLLVTTLLPATTGLAFVGTLYGGLTAGSKGRETLLPLLVLPVVAPVLIGATRATESALGTGGAALSRGLALGRPARGVRRAFGVGGALAFGPLIEECT